MDDLELEAIYTIWLREMKRFLRERSRIIGNISMPFIWLAIMGVGLNSSINLPGVDVSYLSYMAPGIIGMSLLFTSMFSGVSVIWDKQFGFLKEILVAPVSRISIVIGKIVGSSTISLINGTLIIIISIIMGALPFGSFSFVSLIMAFVFMILVSFTFVGIGLIIASRLNSMEGFQMIMSFLIMPLFFLSGAFFPLDNAPIWMKSLAYIDPLMYGVDGLRYSFIGVSRLPIVLDLVVLLGFSTVLIGVAAFLFSRMSE